MVWHVVWRNKKPLQGLLQDDNTSFLFILLSQTVKAWLPCACTHSKYKLRSCPFSLRCAVLLHSPNSGVRLMAVCGTLSLLFSPRWNVSYCLQDACYPRFPLGAVGPQHLLVSQKKCHTKRNNTSMVRLCALTPWLYGLLFMRDFTAHNSIKRSLITELWYLFPKTARNFSAMWKQPKQKRASRNSLRFFQTICLAFQSPDQRWQPHPSDQDYLFWYPRRRFIYICLHYIQCFEGYLTFWKLMDVCCIAGGMPEKNFVFI